MIRYDSKLNKKLSNIVRVYNSKITRLAKQGIEVPTKVNVSTIKRSFTNRRDLIFYIKDLNEFIKKDALKKVKYRKQLVFQYHANIIKRNRRRLSSQIAYKRRQFMFTHAATFGRPSRLSMADEFNIDYLRLEALEERFIKEPIENVTRFISAIQKNTQKVDYKTWQQNYSEMILDVAYTYGIPHAQIHEFRERLLNLSPKKFDLLLRNERSLQSIIYYYKEINDVGVDIAFDEMEEDVVALFNALFSEQNNILKDYE